MFLGSIFGYVVQFFYLIFRNYGVAIIFFTIFTRLLMFPLTIKQQKSMAQQQRLQPKVNELKAKYGKDKNAYNAAVQELYQKEGISASGGCLPMLIQFPLFFGMYAAIREPLSNVLHIATEKIDVLKNIFSIADNDYYYQINIINKIREFSQKGQITIGGITSGSDAAAAVSGSDVLSSIGNSITNAVGGAITDVDVTERVRAVIGTDSFDSVVRMSDSFSFLGIDLLQTASIAVFSGALILAFITFISQVASMIISNKMNKVQTTQGCNQNVMAIVFGGMSFFFAFATPAAFPLYWTVSSLLAPAQTWVTKEYFGPVVVNAKSEAQRNAKLRMDEDKTLKQINAIKGGITLEPYMPAIEEGKAQDKAAKSANNNSGNKNKSKNNNKNKNNNQNYRGKKK